MPDAEKMQMKKQWMIAYKETDGCAPEAACQGMSRLVRTILAGRGIVTTEECRAFLAPSLADMHDPVQLKGVDAAVKRLLAARERHEKVCIYGDYDVDGITGTALLVSFLREVGFDCCYFIPNRFEDGYGLGLDALERIVAMGAALIVSVDCGITAVDEANYCRQQGVDLIIVDHHAPGALIPDAVAVINPLQHGCCYPFKALAGVGVAFNLLVALRAELRNNGAFASAGMPDLRQWLDLVALGTIADVVPLTGQNRIYVFHGLKQLSNSTKSGICSLKQVAGIGESVSCGQVGFRLAPRLNAAGRMESAVPGVELLLGKSLAESQRIAVELDEANAERQSVERRIFDEAVAMVEQAGDYPARRCIVLASPGWHQGVVGIVASRLVERYHRPTLLIALSGDGSGKGSGRSIPGFHLLDALRECSGHLERFGGHKYAAGVSLRESNLSDFTRAFEAEVRRLLGDDDLVPSLVIDAAARPEEITVDFVRELERLAPFGAGNPEPVLMLRDMAVVGRRVVGGGHLKLSLASKGMIFEAIAFRMADFVVNGPVDVAFYPEINEWNGSSRLQLRVKDLRPAE